MASQWQIQDFGQGGSEVLSPEGALSLKFAQNTGFLLKVVCKLHGFEKILGVRGARAPRAPLDALVHHYTRCFSQETEAPERGIA